jgi:phage tail sheath protein FI
MTGILAKRTLQRGAWIAPANEPLKSVLALEAALPEVRRVALVEAGVNVISREPRGFLPLAAETLSLDPDYRQANVRRLMGLIRRVALRHGTGYVFEPNDATLRRTVERTFEGLMEDLFRRGAFAGRTPVTSYQVDCGPRVNPPANHELGRFVVEIRVAPSLPMRFLTVLLVQSGATLSAIEGAAR